MWPLYTGFTVQSNIVNSKSYEQDILFRSIESSNDREVDKIIYNPKKDYKQFSFLPNIKKLCACKRNDSGDVSYSHIKTCVIIDII